MLLNKRKRNLARSTFNQKQLKNTYKTVNCLRQEDWEKKYKERKQKSNGGLNINQYFCFQHKPSKRTKMVKCLYCKPKYRANIIYHLIFVLFLFFFFPLTLPAVRTRVFCFIIWSVRYLFNVDFEDFYAQANAWSQHWGKKKETIRVIVERLSLFLSGAPNENIVQNQLNIVLLNVF